MKYAGRHGQMTTRRKAHDTHFIRIYAPLRSIFAYQLNSALHVAKHIRLSVSSEKQTIMTNICPHTGYPIGQHKCGNAVFLQPFRHPNTFCWYIQPMVTTTRTHNNGNVTSCFSFGNKWCKRNARSLFGRAFPYPYLCVWCENNR